MVRTKRGSVDGVLTVPEPLRACRRRAALAWARVVNPVLIRAPLETDEAFAVVVDAEDGTEGRGVDFVCVVDVLPTKVVEETVGV